MDERKQNEMNESQQDEEGDEEKEPKTVLGILTRQQVIMLCVAVGLVVLLLIITVSSVLTTKSGSGTFLVRVHYLTLLIFNKLK